MRHIAGLVAGWIGDRLPRVDAASDRIDWCHVWLVAGPVMAAIVAIALSLVDAVFHTSILPSSAAAPRSLGRYAAAHARADMELGVAGVVAAAYSILVWLLTKAGRRRDAVLGGEPIADVTPAAGRSPSSPPHARPNCRRRPG